MGGERETVLSASKPNDSVEGMQLGTNIRMHENKGEVQLHDDKANLKFAMPVDSWWTLYQKINDEPNEIFTRTDIKNKSILRIGSKIKEKKNQVPELRLIISIEELNVSADYKKLADFTNQK
jgi:hypothetical protein